LVHQHVLCFIVSEVKMPCSRYPKAKAIQSCVRKQNNCPSFGSKSTSHTNGTNMFGVDLHGQYKICTGDCGLQMQTVDCGLQTTDYRLGIKIRLRYKTRADSGIKLGLRTKCSLLTAVHVFY